MSNPVYPSFLIYSRDRTAIISDNGAKPRVNAMSWNIYGGPKDATATIYSPNRNTLYSFISTLGLDVEMWSDLASPVWWGFINEVSYRYQNIEIGYSLDDMTNAVQVWYTDVQTNQYTAGTQQRTPWQENADSIGFYGRKELIDNVTGMDVTSATQRAVNILNKKVRPQGVFHSADATESASVSLRMKGHFYKLNWRLALIPAGVGVTHGNITGIAAQSFGSSASSPYIMQTVTMTGFSNRVLYVYVPIWKTGTPTDNVTLGIYAVDTNHLPTGSPLVSASKSGSSLGATANAWDFFSISSGHELASGTEYALRFSRSGAVDASNYYNIGVNPALTYSDGIFRIWNGSSWVARSPDADMLFTFRVDSLIETSQQIADIVRMFSPLSGTKILDASGIKQHSFRKGDKYAMSEIIGLLDSGDVNGNLYTAIVDKDKLLRLAIAPPSTALNYYIDGSGNLYPTGSGKIPALAPPYGVWGQVLDLIPTGLNISQVIDSDRFFVKESKWTYNEGVSYQFFGNKTPDQMADLRIT